MGNSNIKLLEDARAEHREPYEWKSAAVNIAAATATVNIRTKTGFTTLFDTLHKNRAHHIRIEASATTYVRLNADDNDIITITSTTPYEDHYGIIEAIFISTNAGASTVTVKLG